MTDARTTGAQNTHNWDKGPVLPLDATRAYYQFLTHLTKAHKVGLKWPVETLAEFGSGTSFAVGFCALFAGASRYIAFDYLPLVNMPQQAELAAQIRRMFIERAPAMNDLGKVAIAFPHDIIPNEILERTLSDGFFRDVVASLGGNNLISYVAPYAGKVDRYSGHLDFIMSTATMEHVEDAGGLYRVFRSLLRPGGTMSHSIDMRSHGYTKPWKGKTLWNSHWLLDDREWADVTSGQDFSINRLPASSHIKMIVENGFKLLSVQKRVFQNELKWFDLAHRFQWMTNEDIECSGLLVITRGL